VLFLINILKLK